MKNKKIFFIYLFSIIANLANAIDVPNDFLYQDRPIDPNCILESNIAHTIDLKECSKHHGKKITNYILEDGLIGYKYINLENNYPGSITYKYLGKIDNLHVVHAFIIGGSVSRLNYINYFKVNGDVLKLVKRGPSGDRSLGGISNTKIENNNLSYDMSLTAKLFVTNFSHDYKISFEDLADCAICQFALVHYINNKIISVTLNSELGIYKQNPIQQCFNNIHNSFIRNKHLNLSTKEAEKFAKLFISECIN